MKKISSILFITALFLTLPFLTAFADDLGQQQKFCEPVKRYKELEYFKNIQAIHIHVQLPQPIQDALTCHAKGYSCSDMMGAVRPDDKLQAAAHKRQIEVYKDVYASYPKELLPESLFSFIAERIGEIILFQQNEGECVLPPIHHAISQVSEDPHILSVIVKLYFDEITGIKFTAMEIDFYRSGALFADYRMRDIMSTIIIVAGDNLYKQMQEGFERSYRLYTEPLVH